MVPRSVSVYDQFVALHGAVFAVLAPGLPPGGTVNFGHWNIGFCAWHRKYLREFEKALQAEVAGVTLPTGTGATTSARSGRSSSPSSWGRWEPAPRPAGRRRPAQPGPAGGRPAWWPAGAEGFPIHPAAGGRVRPRPGQGSVGVGWPPTVAGIQQLEQLVVQQPGVHLLVLLAGPGAGPPAESRPARTTGATTSSAGTCPPGSRPTTRCSGSTHANVDRLWANWQARRLAEVPGSAPQDHYPPPAELSPLDGDPAPPGHRLDDQMWPWVGAAPGFDVEIDPAVKPLLPDFSGVPAVTVREMLQTETVDPEGYRYAAPGQP